MKKQITQNAVGKRMAGTLVLLVGLSGVGFAQAPSPAPSEAVSAATPPTATRAQMLLGDVAPKLAVLTDEVLYADVWERPALSKRDRSLVTVSALIALNRPDQLRSHLALAMNNGVAREELSETITHLAFYAGWPSAVSAAGIAKDVFAAAPPPSPSPSGKTGPLMIQKQGSFAVGGTVREEPGTFDPIRQGAYSPDGVSQAGQTLHGDHAYVFYQIPEQARKLPLVFWHGHGQSAKTWETTPDGREGFQNLFLRKQYPVYLMDQPRRGRAARSTEPVALAAVPDEQLWFGIFRLGAWPDFYEGVQFSKDPEALNQFFRQMVPNTGLYDANVNIAAVSELFGKIGGGILVTHSQSGGPGWRAAIHNEQIRAIVSFEPGGDFLFPEGEAPETIQLAGRTVTPPTVSTADFMRLTKIPILVYYGDNIPDQPSENPGQEQWRVFLEVAMAWRDVVNRHGGDVTIVHLPDIGIHGNTHFPMSDLNNAQIADLMSDWLAEKGMDEEDSP